MAVLEKTIGPLNAEDVSGQIRRRINAVPTDTYVSEVLSQLRSDMALPGSDPQGRPITYTVRLERTSTSLGSNQKIGDIGIEPNDTLRLLPDVTAGGENPNNL